MQGRGRDYDFIISIPPKPVNINGKTVIFVIFCHKFERFTRNISIKRETGHLNPNVI